jgi:hypothetical protein
MIPHPDDPETWPACRPTIIAHDVAGSRDFSTAVVGGPSPFELTQVGILQARELPQKLYGNMRASALAEIDREFYGNCLIVADLSHDPSYAEILHQTFGRRVIGLHITRYGDGMQCELRPVADGVMKVYTIGRTYLFDLLHTHLQAREVRLSKGPDVALAYQQLNQLDVELRDTGRIYTCPVGQHDDLAISTAMLVWAAQHYHLHSWMNELTPRPRRPRKQISWEAWT